MPPSLGNAALVRECLPAQTNLGAFQDRVPVAVVGMKNRLVLHAAILGVKREGAVGNRTPTLFGERLPGGGGANQAGELGPRRKHGFERQLPPLGRLVPFEYFRLEALA